jgi:hypothetical protein
MSAQYDQDFYSWTQEQAKALREGRLTELDREHLAEEIEDMGKSEARGLRSQLARLLKHLLKWVHQPELLDRKRNSWGISIRDARRKIRECLEENPGLRSRLPELFEKGYIDAIVEVVEETNLPDATFPTVCPWTLEQVLDDAFWPQ